MFNPNSFSNNPDSFSDNPDANPWLSLDPNYQKSEQGQEERDMEKIFDQHVKEYEEMVREGKITPEEANRRMDATLQSITEGIHSIRDEYRARFQSAATTAPRSLPGVQLANTEAIFAAQKAAKATTESAKAEPAQSEASAQPATSQPPQSSERYVGKPLRSALDVAMERTDSYDSLSKQDIVENGGIAEEMVSASEATEDRTEMNDPDSIQGAFESAHQQLDDLGEKGEETDALLASVKEMLNNESGTTEITEFPHTEESRATADRARRNGPCKKAFSRRARATIAAVITTLTIALSAFGVGAQATDSTHEPTPYTPAGESQTQVMEEAPSASLGSGSTVILKGPQKIINSAVKTAEGISQTATEEAGASTIEATPVKGELSNGTTYDYTEYSDFQNKISPQAFGHDKTELFGNDQGTREGILNMATNPEVLASYAYYVFNDDEKAELGISNMTATEIDDFMSTNEKGGEMQQKLFNKLKEVINSDATTLNFYHENSTEISYYIYYEDTNNDGKMTPDEMHLRYSERERNNAPQVDIFRSDGNGGSYKVMDLNMQCGFQQNLVVAPEGITYVAPATEKSTPTPAVATSTPSSTVTPGTPAPSVVVTPETSTPTDDETPASESTPTSTPETQDEETPSDEGTPDEENTPENNPTPNPEPAPEPAPEPLQLKDAENLTRVANDTFENNATNNGTETVTTTPTEEVSVENITPIPSGAETYNGTSYTDNIVQSESASGSSSTGSQAMTAEVVAPPSTPANDISQNRGGANSESGYTPVQNNSSAQAQAESRQDTSASSAASAMSEFNTPAPQGESQE